MKINELLLINFRSHQRKKVEFACGVNAIVGRNGAGKTSIMEAVVFALTGGLFHGNKESAIRSGCDSGHVEMTFVINGKPGKIKRYLDVTKVTLDYDGTTYKKVGEVKEVWDKLLQVQPEFIENIITARQGKIHSLFSTDDEVSREKLFQKIFLVPPTEKIRSSLYRNYMKQCPPMIPVEDPAQIHTIKTDKLRDIRELEQHLSSLHPESKEEFNQLIIRKNFLEACKRDRIAISSGLRNKERLTGALSELRKRESGLQEKVDALDILPYEEEVARLQAISNQLAAYKQITVVLDNYKAVSESSILAAREAYEKLFELGAAEKATLNRLVEKLVELNDWFNNEGTIGHKNCPLCKQSLEHAHEFNNSRLLELDKLNEEYAAAAASTDKLNVAVTEAKIELNSLTIQLNKKNELEGKLNNLRITDEDITDLSKLAEYEEVVACYKEYAEELGNTQHEIAKLTTELASLDLMLARYSVYDKPGSLDVELQAVVEAIEKAENSRAAFHNVNVKLQIAQARITELDERLVVAERDNEKNGKRNRYLEVISRIYDGFHSSNFPRKLVQTYTGAVTERLKEKLESFELPFTASINDKFETHIFDKEHKRIPTASGGQQVLLGLALHLALHDLFSQSFPLFMIDEGSAHLDAENRGLYFNLVNSLRSEKKLNQIIIIDHHDALKEVVDHVIEL